MKRRVSAFIVSILLSAFVMTMSSCRDPSDSTETTGEPTTGAVTTDTVTTTVTLDGPSATSPAATVSKVEVPNVGYPMTEAEAISALAAVGLAAAVDYVSSTGSMDFGRVVGQDPAPGTLVALGSTVSITVHGTGERAEVPYLIGMTEDEAANALFDKYLHYRVERVPGPVKSGRIWDQDPDAGTLVTEGTSVVLYISP